MRAFTTFILVTLMTQAVISQDIKKCREIIKITAEAVNTGSSVELEKYLAPNFEIADQKGDLAKKILKQLFTQLGDTIQSSLELSFEMNEKSLTIIHSFSYSKMGQKNATFVFDEDNKLKKLALFEMEVKTMDSSKRNFIKPQNAIIKIPFFMIGNLIATEVRLNNEKKVFLFDSGSPKVILNSRYISINDSVYKKTISSSKGVGGNISGMDIEEVKKLEFGGIIMKDQDVLTLDISHLEKGLKTDIEIYGLIGYELIKDYDLLFDYEKKELTLIDPVSFNQYKNEHFFDHKLSIIPFNLSSHIPVFNGRIANKDYFFGIDCGAEINLMNDDLLALMYKHLKNTKIDTLLGADKNHKEITKGLIKETIIGGKKFKNMETLFSNISHLNNGYKLKLDGLMGYELLSKQKTLISYHRKQLILIE